MVRKEGIFVLAFLFVLSGASAMTLIARTMPAVLTPGSAGKLVITLQPAGPASGVEFKIDDVQQLSIEREGQWTYLGDIDGTPLTYVLGISVPADIKPGTYAVPVEIEYEDSTGKMRTQYTYIFIPVSGGGISVRLPGAVSGGKIQTVPITIVNKGPAITDAYLIVPGALGSAETYVGTIPADSNVVELVSLLPTCRNGLFETNIMIRGMTDSNAIMLSFPYVVQCNPPTNAITVDMNMPETTTGGEYNTVLRITNNLDIAVGPITVTLTGKNIDIGGQTGYSFAAIGPHQTIEIPIKWKLQQDDMPGAIVVNIYETNFPRTYVFSTIPSTEPEIQAYISGEPKWSDGGVQVSITVANVGTGTAKTVYVSAEGNNIINGNTVIGDLAPGDYDTATVTFRPTGRETTVKAIISYFKGGKKHTITEEFTVQTPPKPQPVGLWILLAIAVIAGIWWWRKRK